MASSHENEWFVAGSEPPDHVGQGATVAAAWPAQPWPFLGKLFLPHSYWSHFCARPLHNTLPPWWGRDSNLSSRLWPAPVSEPMAAALGVLKRPPIQDLSLGFCNFESFVFRHSFPVIAPFSEKLMRKAIRKNLGHSVDLIFSLLDNRAEGDQSKTFPFVFEAATVGPVTELSDQRQLAKMTVQRNRGRLLAK